VAELAGRLGALIEGAAGRKAAKDFEERGLEPKKDRVVRFWDTDGCVLAKRGFALRERTEAAKPKEPELTLKFRSTDLFLAAGTPLPGGPGAESKLEEDVGPLAARQGDVTPAVVVAKPRSARSQYARSTKQPVRPEELPRTLRDVASSTARSRRAWGRTAERPTCRRNCGRARATANACSRAAR
jgi:hypothetical protein